MSKNHVNPEAVRVRILEKAAADGEFRSRLLAHPKATIEHELGVTLGPDLEIQVVEETASRICLVLPVLDQPSDGIALSEGDLEHVAGGTLPGPLPRVANLPGPMPDTLSSFDRLSNVLDASGELTRLFRR